MDHLLCGYSVFGGLPELLSPCLSHSISLPKVMTTTCARLRGGSASTSIATSQIETIGTHEMTPSRCGCRKLPLRYKRVDRHSGFIPRPTSSSNRSMRSLLYLALMELVISSCAFAQAVYVPLTSTERLRIGTTTAQAASFKGARSIRATQVSGGPEGLILVEGIAFHDGVIEIDVAGRPGAEASDAARGFVGVAFRVQPGVDGAAPRYDAFYLRPTNGRAIEQERRNHATQYISHPEWTWSRLRREFPSRYEAYVDVEPDRWTRLRIEVSADTARLFVHGQAHPTLIVTDLKTGPLAAGGVGLWVGPGTVAHFRDLRVRTR